LASFAYITGWRMTFAPATGAVRFKPELSTTQGTRVPSPIKHARVAELADAQDLKSANQDPQTLGVPALSRVCGSSYFGRSWCKFGET